MPRLFFSRWVQRTILFFSFLCLAVGTKTILDLRPLPDTLTLDANDVRKLQVRDRRGLPLSVTYDNGWNYQDLVPLHEIPLSMQQAFVLAEDQHFYSHHGIDWPARFSAILQNLKAFRRVRGASTITEQVVRLLHPRPRTLWSRWLEGFEALALERQFTKDAILEFYLNQVPYAAKRRGVVQASRYYFDRDLDTLNVREMLALAVMVRAPGALDLHRREGGIDRQLHHLAERMKAKGHFSEADYSTATAGEVELRKPTLTVQAGHFVTYLQGRDLPASLRINGRIASTLDASLQSRVQAILDRRLKDLRIRQVTNGAALVVDHVSGEVLAWVNGGSDDKRVRGGAIDAILSPRQPGSTLKPFLYAIALEKGWTAATLIDDTPLTSAVGTGLHDFHNYSRLNYGPLPLRECLGNSLNIPAVRAIKYVGAEDFLHRLRALGLASLARPADFYGEGIALGSGEVTLYELVRAYATLARQGNRVDLLTVLGEAAPAPQMVFSEEVSSLVADILSDPEARRLEFGNSNLLNFPVQTAVKTGTSTDYRDAWAIGFSSRYTVGVWMGNLDRTPMKEVTGSMGPALVLRSVFAELNRNEQGSPLYLSPRLVSLSVCAESGSVASPDCPVKREYFLPDHQPAKHCDRHSLAAASHERGKTGKLELLQPTPGLQLAMDPRIPDELEAFSMELPHEVSVERVEWVVDGLVAGRTGQDIHRWLWPVAKGGHQASARVWLTGAPDAVETAKVSFSVK